MRRIDFDDQEILNTLTKLDSVLRFCIWIWPIHDTTICGTNTSPVSVHNLILRGVHRLADEHEPTTLKPA